MKIFAEPMLKKSDRQEPPANSDIDKMVQATIGEARMVLPGIQALFGFQLVAAFNQRFAQLAASDQYLHYAALLCTAVSAAIIMTPAAYHRIAERFTNSNRFIRIASRLVAVAVVPLGRGERGTGRIDFHPGGSIPSEFMPPGSMRYHLTTSVPTCRTRRDVMKSLDGSKSVQDSHVMSSSTMRTMNSMNCRFSNPLEGRAFLRRSAQGCWTTCQAKPMTT